MDIKKVNSAKARRSFSDLLNETGFGGHRIVVTRKGKAVAAMVPLEDLEAIQLLEDQKDINEAKRILSDKESEFIPWEQAKNELFNR
ncbi:MAG TPA: type II toxin-antitoxin system Phd/YefM family antitoxin [Balneolaceae bacterium]|nr:type II toxin-antitoxin system Phd/YefM family antitoxin [Balneolaceae bacterium]